MNIRDRPLSFFEEKQVTEYAFLMEDLKEDGRNPLNIQHQYAERLDRGYLVDLENKIVFNRNKEPVPDLSGKKILLRCSYDYVRPALQFLEAGGAAPVETGRDIDRIENWFLLGLSGREIREYTITRFLQDAERKENYFKQVNRSDCIFIKSKKKGFSAVVRISALSCPAPGLREFINKMKNRYGEEILLSEYLPMKADSLGPRESRHVIMEGELINSSRNLHSVKHTVPKSHITKAKELAKRINELDFPKSYVLDLGEFTGKDGIHLDIVEINPISCSLCYVNNSIFTEMLPEIQQAYNYYHMGYEYCADLLLYPQDYCPERLAGVDYTYASECRYYL